MNSDSVNLALAAVCICFAACQQQDAIRPSLPSPDAQRSGGTPGDAGLIDAATTDASPGDAEEAMDVDAPDVDVPDTGVIDTGVTPDTGLPDATPIDTGFARDADIPEVGVPDTGTRDAQPRDTGAQDAGHPDATVPDAGATAPPRITFSPGTNTRQIGSTSGGSAFTDMCGSDEAIVGLAGRLDSRGWHGRIQAQCAKVAATPTPPYGIVTGAPRTTPLRGLLGSVMWTRSCPTNEVLVGFNGRAGALIDSMTFRCAPVNINLVAGSYQVVIGTATSLPAIGGSGGNAFPTSDCPPGQVATTIRGRAGDNVDAFGLRCSTVNPN